MDVKEARRVLDGVIPPPGNKMVDLAHLEIANAWEVIKAELDRQAKAAASKFYVLKDLSLIGETPKRKAAIDMIRAEQKFETHPWLKANFSIIEGKPQEFIGYPKGR